MRSLIWIPLTALIAVACTSACSDEPPVANGQSDLLAIGDSYMEFHTVEEASIGHAAGEELGLSVENVGIGGEVMLGDHATRIPGQYQDGNHQLVVATGGGNDLSNCTCGENCGPVIDQVISEDGTQGAIPDLAARVLADGKRLAWVGYIQPLPEAEAFADCVAELRTYSDRLNALADSEEGVFFADGLTLGLDATLLSADGYHPSIEGSVALGRIVAEQLQDAE